MMTKWNPTQRGRGGTKLCIDHFLLSLHLSQKATLISNTPSYLCIFARLLRMNTKSSNPSGNVTIRKSLCMNIIYGTFSQGSGFFGHSLSRTWEEKFRKNLGSQISLQNCLNLKDIIDLYLKPGLSFCKSDICMCVLILKRRRLEYGSACCPEILEWSLVDIASFSEGRHGNCRYKLWQNHRCLSQLCSINTRSAVIHS